MEEKLNKILYAIKDVIENYGRNNPEIKNTEIGNDLKILGHAIPFMSKEINPKFNQQVKDLLVKYNQDKQFQEVNEYSAIMLADLLMNWREQLKVNQVNQVN